MTAEADKNLQAQDLFIKAKTAFELGEIYDANIKIRKSLDLSPSPEAIDLAKKIKLALGEKYLAKAKHYLTVNNLQDALLEAQKAESHLDEPLLFEASDIIAQITNKTAGKKTAKRWLRTGITFVSIGLLGYASFWLYNYNNENQRWIETKTKDNIAEYQSFLSSFPQGTYASQARKRLKELAGNDDELWIQALHYPTHSNVESYILKMGDRGGMHMEEAKYMLDSIEFNTAARLGSKEALETYISNNPEGNFLPSARQMLKILITPEEKLEILAYMKTFYDLYESQTYGELLKYFNPVTPRFVNESNIDKADLKKLFESGKENVVEEHIEFDDSSLVVQKMDAGVLHLTFIIDSYRTVKVENSNPASVETTGKKGKNADKKNLVKTVKQYANQEVTIDLDEHRKITHYKIKVLSTEKSESAED